MIYVNFYQMDTHKDLGLIEVEFSHDWFLVEEFIKDLEKCGIDYYFIEGYQRGEDD